MDKIQQYRQPVVTATGIFLGFLFNFISTWMPDAFSRYLVRDVVTGISISLSIALLVVVLFRILRMNYPATLAEKYYRKTLNLLLLGISIPFGAFLINLIRKLVTNVF